MGLFFLAQIEFSITFGSWLNVMYQIVYQTEIFGIIPAISPSAPRRARWALSRALGQDCCMVGLAGKACDRANVGGMWAR